MENKMETTIMGYTGYRIWDTWGSYYNIPKAIVYLLKGDYKRRDLGSLGIEGFWGFEVQGFESSRVVGHPPPSTKAGKALHIRF